MKTMMKTAVMMMAAAALSAADAMPAGPKIPLWPEGRIPDFQSHQVAAMLAETKAPGFDPDSNRMPHLQWYPPPAATAKTDVCMIIISGGGYNRCCDIPAFETFVTKLLDAGIHCVNMTYRTPRPKGIPIYKTAWEDGQRGVRMVRSMAAERGFDPEKIGVTGCSAGSHLSLLLAFSSQTPAYEPVDDLDKIPCHINWAIPFCPAYALTDGMEGPNKMKGEGPGVELHPAFAFDSKTCPVCFFHGGKDPYSPIGSTMAYRRLHAMNIPAELHLDADRGHGLVRPPVYERAMEFMRQMEFIGKLERPKAQDHRFFPGDTIRTEKEMLWPKGRMPDPSPNQTYDPYLVWFIPEKLSTKAVQVIVPGGAYNFCNFNGEGTPVAHYLNGKGMAAVVVMYRCPRPEGNPKHFSALQDAQRAVRMVRAEAPKRGLDPGRIGLMGFSAGGHLTIVESTTSKTSAYKPVDEIDGESCSVQWAVPIYPAYVLNEGDDSAFAPELTFDEATPIMCLVHGDADKISPLNSVMVWEKLRRMGLQSDLHTLAKRGHCFQMSASPGTGSYTWMDRVWEFLTRKGLNK